MLAGISGKIGSGKDTFANLLVAAIHASKHPGTDPDFTFEDITNPELYTGVKKMNGIEIHKFADALKDMVCRLTGCTREQLEDQDFKNSVMPLEWYRTGKDALLYCLEHKLPYNHDKIYKDGMYTYATKLAVQNGLKLERTYREFLQELGTNVLRNWIPNIHVNATFSTWKPIPVPVTKAKITGWGRKPGELSIQKEKMPKWIITDMRFPNEAQAVKERGGILLRIRRDTAGILSNHPSETALDDYTGWDAVINNDGTLEELYQQAINITNQFNLHNE